MTAKIKIYFSFNHIFLYYYHYNGFLSHLRLSSINLFSCVTCPCVSGRRDCARDLRRPVHEYVRDHLIRKKKIFYYNSNTNISEIFTMKLTLRSTTQQADNAINVAAKLFPIFISQVHWLGSN